MAKNDLFDDTADAPDDESPDGDRPSWSAPEGHERPVGGPGWGEQARLRWDTATRGQKIGVAAVVAVAALMGLSWMAGRAGPDDVAPEPPAPTVTIESTAPTPSTEPPRQLVQAAANRERDDPLRNLPDLHPMVVAYAGDAAASFSNAVNVLLAGGADLCGLHFGVSPEGWRVVPHTEGIFYPNDFFPVRVFLGHPCLGAVGVADPQVVPTTTSTVPA